MFMYELTPEPTALFKVGYMQKRNKSGLRNKTLDENVIVPKPKVDGCIVNGGLFLHKTVWIYNSSYNEIVSQYLNYLNDRFSSITSNIIVVFDGNNSTYSTK